MLGDIWLVNGEQRRAITAASDEIEKRLAKSPASYSKPVHEGLFAIRVHPLHVIF
jgi:hypothetical protein